jgi:hypothetical protein
MEKCQHSHKCKHTSKDHPKLLGVEVEKMSNTHIPRKTLLDCLPSQRQTMLQGLSIGTMLCLPYAYVCTCAAIDHKEDNLLMGMECLMTERR